MSQAKKQMESNDESTYVSDSLVETFWNQYETSLNRAQERTEERYNAYLNVIKQTNKFSSEYRNMIKGFYEESSKTNAELVKGFSTNISAEVQKEPKEETKEVYNQWRDTFRRVEKVSYTPIKQSIEIIERLEKRSEESTELYLNYLKENGKQWTNVRNQYLKILRDQNKLFARRLEDSFRALVNN